MKKRCTNPACRRYFTPRQAYGSVTCPHCGKTYGPMGLVSVMLTGVVPGKKMAVVKAFWKQNGNQLRQAKQLVDSLSTEPFLLGSWPADRAEQTAREWEALGGVVRLSATGDALRQTPDHPDCFAVVMTGYQPGKAAQASMMAYRRLGDIKQARKAVRQIRSQQVLLAERLTRQEAQAMADQARERGVHVSIRWQRAG